MQPLLKAKRNLMTDDIGKLILRVAFGAMILAHGIYKLTHGINPIEQLLEGAGLPALLAYAVYVGEVLAPILLMLGFYSRIGASLIAVNMLFAIGLVHRKELFALDQNGGWAIELQALFLFVAIALSLVGPGHYRINDK